MSYYTGTSGLLLPYKNKSFYPETLQDKSRLHVYSLLFNSIEVNSSFYKIPQFRTIARWSQEVGGGFRFTFKLWKGITHVKDMEYNDSDLVKFIEAINAVDGKKGCLLIQLPPSASKSLFSRLEKLLDKIGTYGGSDWNICVEFRHASWYAGTTYRMLDSCKAGIVFHDKNSSGMNIDETDAPFIYLRFHGPGGNYRGSYDDAVLEEYAHYITDWQRSGREVFVYFNNTMGAAIDNLRYLEKSVKHLL